ILCEKPEAYWNEYKPLRGQVGRPDTHLRIYPKAIQFNADEEQWAAQCFTVAQFPEATCQWEMGELLGSAFDNAKNIPYPFLLTLTMHITPETRSETKVETHFHEKTGKLQKGDAKRFLTGLSKACNDWPFIQVRLHDSDKLIELLSQAAIFTVW